MSALTFTTRSFERSTGRKAKGFGTWAFQATSRETAFASELLGETEFFSGTLTEAKAALRATGASGLWALLG